MSSIFIISGPPGSGKSSTLQVLESKGYHIIREAVPKVLQKYEYSHPNFRSRVIETQLKDIDSAPAGVSFADRSLVDTKVYSDLAGDGKFNVDIKKLPYQKNVFFFPEVIDKEVTKQRPHNLEKRIETAQKLKQAYLDYGFEVIEVPMAPPEERAEYILKQLKM